MQKAPMEGHGIKLRGLVLHLQSSLEEIYSDSIREAGRQARKLLQ